MKLHLPTTLRKAVLTGLASLITTTLATGVLAYGGLCTFTMAAESPVAIVPETGEDEESIAGEYDIAPIADESGWTWENPGNVNWGTASGAANAGNVSSPGANNLGDAAASAYRVAGAQGHYRFTGGAEGGSLLLDHSAGAGNPVYLYFQDCNVANLWLWHNGASTNNRNYYMFTESTGLDRLQNIYVSMTNLCFGKWDGGSADAYASLTLSTNIILGSLGGNVGTRGGGSGNTGILNIAHRGVTTSGYLEIGADNAIVFGFADSSLAVSDLRGSHQLTLHTAAEGATLTLTKGGAEFGGTLTFSERALKLVLGASGSDEDVTLQAAGLTGTAGAQISRAEGSSQNVKLSISGTGSSASGIVLSDGVVLALAENATQTLVGATLNGGLELATGSSLMFTGAGSTVSGALSGSGMMSVLDGTLTLNGAVLGSDLNIEVNLSAEGKLSLSDIDFESYQIRLSIADLLIGDELNGYELISDWRDDYEGKIVLAVDTIGRKSISLENGALVITGNPGDLTWNNTDLEWRDETNAEGAGWVSGSGTDSFYNGDNVTFDNEAGGTVTLGDDVIAGDMTIASGEWTYNADAHALTVQGMLDLGDNEITLSGGTFDVAELSGSGTINYNGTALTIADASSFSGTLVMQAGLTLSADLEFAEGGKIVGSTEHDLVIAAGVTYKGDLELQRSPSSGNAGNNLGALFLSGAVTLDGNMTLLGNTRIEGAGEVNTLTGDFDAQGYYLEVIRGGGLTVQGEVRNLGILYITNCTVTFVQDITQDNLAEGATGINMAGARSGYTGTLKFEGAVSGISTFNNGGGNMLFANSLTLDSDTTFSGSGNFTLSHSLTGSVNITKSATGTLTFGEDGDFTGYTGTLTQAAGTTTVNADFGGGITLSKDSSLNVGAGASVSGDVRMTGWSTVTLAGTLGSLEVTSASAWSGGKSNEDKRAVIVSGTDAAIAGAFSCSMDAVSVATNATANRLTVEGELSMGNKFRFTSTTTGTDAGTLALSEGGSVGTQLVLEENGTLEIGDGKTLTVGALHSYADEKVAGGTITTDGTAILKITGTTVDHSAANISIDSGVTLELADGAAQTLTDADIEGDVQLDGDGAVLTLGGMSTVAGDITGSGGTLALASEAEVTFSGTMSSDLTVAMSGAALTLSSEDEARHTLGSISFSGTDNTLVVEAGVWSLAGAAGSGELDITVQAGSTLSLTTAASAEITRLTVLGTLQLGKGVLSVGTLTGGEDATLALGSLRRDGWLAVEAIGEDSHFTLDLTGCVLAKGEFALFTGADEALLAGLDIDITGVADDWTVVYEDGKLIITTELVTDYIWDGTSGGSTLIWGGEAENVVWQDTEEHWRNDVNVDFIGSGDVTVMLGADITAAEMAVSNGSYTFSSSTGNMSLTVLGTLEVTDGATVTLADGLELHLTHISSAEGTQVVVMSKPEVTADGLLLDGAGSVNLSGGLSGSGAVTIDGATVSLNAQKCGDYTGKLLVESGTLTAVGGENAQLGSVNISGGAAAQLVTSGALQIGTLTMADGAAVSVGGDLTLGTLNLSGDAGTYTIAAAAAAGDDSAPAMVTLTNDLSRTGGSLSFDGVNVTTAALTLQGGAALEAGKNLTANGDVTVSGNSTLTVGGDADIKTQLKLDGGGSSVVATATVSGTFAAEKLWMQAGEITLTQGGTVGSFKYAQYGDNGSLIHLGADLEIANLDVQQGANVGKVHFTNEGEADMVYVVSGNAATLNVLAGADYGEGVGMATKGAMTLESNFNFSGTLKADGELSMAGAATIGTLQLQGNTLNVTDTLTLTHLEVTEGAGITLTPGGHIAGLSDITDESKITLTLTGFTEENAGDGYAVFTDLNVNDIWSYFDVDLQGVDTTVYDVEYTAEGLIRITEHDYSGDLVWNSSENGIWKADDNTTADWLNNGRAVIYGTEYAADGEKSVVFNAEDGLVTTIAVDGTVSVLNMTVNGEYTFSGTEDGTDDCIIVQGNLKTTAATGIGVDVQVGGAAAIGGTLTVSGAELSVEQSLSSEAELTVGEDGVLRVGGELALRGGTTTDSGKTRLLTVDGGEVTAGTLVATAGEVFVADGSLTLQEGGSVSSLAISGTVRTDGELTVAALDGEGTLSGEGTVTLTAAAGTFSGHITAKSLVYNGGADGEFSLTFGYGGETLSVESGTLVLGDVTTTHVSVASAATLKIDVGATLTTDDSSTGAVTLGEEATLNLAGYATAGLTVNMLGGGTLQNAAAFTGKLIIDDTENAGQSEFHAGGAAQALCTLTLHSGSYVDGLSGSITLSGINALTLATEGNLSAAEAFLRSDGELTVAAADGAKLKLDAKTVYDYLMANTDEERTFYIFDHAASGWQGILSLDADMLFYLDVTVNNNGSITFAGKKAALDNVFQSSENEGENNRVELEGYDSLDGYLGAYVDSETHVDLTGESLPADDENGLVMRNVTGKAGSRLHIEGRNDATTGERSLVSFQNTLKDEDLEAYAEENGLDISAVENKFTMAADVSVQDADLQIKHVAAGNEHLHNSRTVLTGELSITNGDLLMTSGELELQGGADVEGVKFTGDDGQLIVNAVTAGVSSLSITADGCEDAEDHAEHVRIENGGELLLKDGAQVGDGLVIGNADAFGGTVTVSGDGQEGASISALTQLKGVVLNLQGDLDIVPGAMRMRARAAAPIAQPRQAEAWELAGITGSGALSGQMDMDITVRGSTRTYSGDMSGYEGTMTFHASPYEQVFAGAVGSRSWNVVSNAGSNVRYNLMTNRANLMVMGDLTLARGSHTTIVMDLTGAGRCGLDVGRLSIGSGASVTIAQYRGTVTLAGANGSVYKLGVIDPRSGSDVSADVRWKLEGVRNAAQVYVDSTDGVTLMVRLDNSNRYAVVANNANSYTGANMLWNLGSTQAYGGDLAAVDAAVLGMVNGGAAGRAQANRVMAAVAGASLATVGRAVDADLERQLRAVRNRTSALSYNAPGDETVHLSFWVNAETNYYKQDADGMLPGVKTNGWGGTAGMVINQSSSLNLGLALTAMYNDLTASGADTLKGDVDTLYMSAFAQVADGAWRHTFVCSIGQADVSATRTVNYGTGSYTTHMDTKGMAFGLMYEAGYAVPLDKESTLCLQPVFNAAWRYTRMDAYTEHGSNAALSVGDQDQSTLTLGLGVRVQAAVGESTLNTAGHLEARALVKQDIGDHRSVTTTALLNTAGGVESAKRGATGLELGAGYMMPLGKDVDLFMDASAEFRSGETNLNATLGVKLNF